MTLSPARVVSRSQAAGATSVRPVGVSSSLPTARVVNKSIVDAERRAREITEAAEREATLLLARARAELAELHERTMADARALGAARLAAEHLALAAQEESTDRRALDRVVALARLLAERLLGETLALEPSRVTALAEQALKEARGARRITIVAHPADVVELERALGGAQREHVTRIVPDAGRARGNLRFETDIGILDADIAPQLDRLAQRLREAVAHER